MLLESKRKLFITLYFSEEIKQQNREKALKYETMYGIFLFCELKLGISVSPKTSKGRGYLRFFFRFQQCLPRSAFPTVIDCAKIPLY